MATRLLDVIVAAVGLVALSPLLLVLAALVRRDSAGPALYRAERIGQWGRPFHMLKFRSMVVGADRMGGSVTGAADPRVTRVGAFLRRAKLDELPSLWNVLRGEMSLVGPRPESPPWVARYTAEQRAVLRLKPGITGVAQLRYRDEEALLGDEVEARYPAIMADKLALDLDYARRRSLLSDIGVLARTALVVFRRS